MRVALIGATGLVGSLLLDRLAGHDVLVLTRRSTGRNGVRETIAPAEEWPRLLASETLDVAISALGTTWRKAGSWPEFEAIDRAAVAAFAHAAKDAGARQMISVSSAGADPSSQNGYLAIKGRAERDLAELDFARLDILRPGLLRGSRASDRRLGERLGILVSPLINLVLRGPFDRFAAIDAATVANSLAALIGRTDTGRFVHHNREIRSFATGDAPTLLR